MLPHLSSRPPAQLPSSALGVPRDTAVAALCADATVPAGPVPSPPPPPSSPPGLAAPVDALGAGYARDQAPSQPVTGDLISVGFAAPGPLTADCATSGFPVRTCPQVATADHGRLIPNGTLHLRPGRPDAACHVLDGLLHQLAATTALQCLRAELGHMRATSATIGCIVTFVGCNTAALTVAAPVPPRHASSP